MNHFFILIPYSAKGVHRHSTLKKVSVLLALEYFSFNCVEVQVATFAHRFHSISSGEQELNSSLLIYIHFSKCIPEIPCYDFGSKIIKLKRKNYYKNTIN